MMLVCDTYTYTNPLDKASPGEGNDISTKQQKYNIEYLCLNYSVLFLET
jgi:hypothetical protein